MRWKTHVPCAAAVARRAQVEDPATVGKLPGKMLLKLFRYSCLGTNRTLGRHSFARNFLLKQQPEIVLWGNSRSGQQQQQSISIKHKINETKHKEIELTSCLVSLDSHRATLFQRQFFLLLFFSFLFSQQTQCVSPGLSVNIAR